MFKDYISITCHYHAPPTATLTQLKPATWSQKVIEFLQSNTHIVSELIPGHIFSIDVKNGTNPCNEIMYSRIIFRSESEDVLKKVKELIDDEYRDTQRCEWWTYAFFFYGMIKETSHPLGNLKFSILF